MPPVLPPGYAPAAVNVWPTHFQHSGQPDAKTAEGFILSQLEEEYH